MHDFPRPGPPAHASLLRRHHPSLRCRTLPIPGLQVLRTCPPGQPRRGQQPQSPAPHIRRDVLESIIRVERHLRLDAVGLPPEAVCDQVGEKRALHAADRR